MPILNVEGVTHWSIPVNDLEEAEEFYGELLGLAPVGRLGNNIMSCFNVGDHNILLCERPNPVDGPLKEDAGVHHSFTVSPETFELACKVFHERNVTIDHLTYRARGVFTADRGRYGRKSGCDTAWEGAEDSGILLVSKPKAGEPPCAFPENAIRCKKRLKRIYLTSPSHN